MAIDKVRLKIKTPSGSEGSAVDYTPTPAELASGKANFKLWKDLIPDGVPATETDLPISLGTVPINQPPIIIGESQFFGEPSSSITISQDFSDPENDPLNISWLQVSGDRVDFTISTDRKSISFTPSQEGEYRFDVEANDGVNATHKLLSVLILDNQPPVITLPSEVNGLINQEIRITAAIIDPEGDPLGDIEWTQPATQIVDFRVSADHLTLSFTPTKVGEYIFFLRAEDIDGAESTATVRAIVTEQQPEPVEIPIIAVRASGEDLNKTAAMAIDGDFETRWSKDGKDEWWEADFNAVWKLDRIEITGFHYDREYYFQIEGDSKIYTVPANRAPNTLIPFDLKDRNLIVSKIRVIGQGNQNSDYNSYREIKFFGIRSGDVPNQPPKIEVAEAINTTVGTATVITSKISDIDGTIQTIRWTQINGSNVNFTVSADQQSITFIPQTVSTITFKLEAIDDDGALTSKIITVNITEKSQSFKIEAFADTDVGNNPESVLDAIFREKDVEAWIFGGDGPYASRGTAWVNMMKKYFTPDIVEDLIISQGNHEHPESETQQAEADIEAWRPALNQSPEGMDWLNAKQINNVYVISMNSQDEDIATKGVQYNWVLNELKKAKSLRDSGQIDWIFAVVHKPWFTLKSSHSAYTAARNNFTDIFKEYGVDIVIHGHNHNTQIWEPMIADKNQSGNGDGISLFTKTSDGAFDFSKEHGWLTVITGHGGHEHNGISNSDPKVLFFNDEDYGFTEFVISGKEIVVNAKDTQNKVMFTCRLVREDTSNPNIPQLNVNFPSNLSVGQQGTIDASNSVADTIETIVTSGQNVNLNEVSKWKWNLTPPDTGQQSYQLALQTTAKKGTGQSIKQIAIQVSKQTTGQFPVPTTWFYSSDQVIANNNGKLTSSKYISNESPNQVLLPSGASGAKNHTISNGKIEIDSGGGNGRLYWDYVKIPEMKGNPKYGKAISFTGEFELQQADNLSIKDGNHGTDGSIIESMNLVFGGFGLSFHETEVQSKVEYNHDVSQGNEVSKTYPNGKKLSRSGKSKFFVTIIANDSDNSVALNAWLDFNDGNGWTKVMTDRTWKKGDSSWSPPSGIPSGNDKQQITDGPAHIVRNHIWTRANQKNLTVWNIQIGIPI